MRKALALVMVFCLLFGVTACNRNVEMPLKSEVKELLEDRYDMEFEFVSKDTNDDKTKAEWVFTSSDGKLTVTVFWDSKNPSEFEFEEQRRQRSNRIGISMPTKDLQRWNQDGDYMKQKFEAAGYQVDLQYAGNKPETQLSQVENMINSGCSVLIIAAIESSSLGEALDKAAAKGIPVIAYDRLLMDNENVSYYATFDNYKVGTIQGEYIRNRLDLDNSSGPFFIEFTAGDPGDSNAGFFFNGAMDVLKPYIDSGKLVVQSGQVSFESVSTPEWSSANAQSRAENIIYTYYSNSQIDAWLCSNDSTAQGVINALDACYYMKDRWPVVTGQDCDIVNVKCILAGKQSMSVFKDTRTLCERTVTMVSQILNGQTVETNNTYDNNKKQVPSYLCDPIFVDINNYRQILIESGYYSEDLFS